jgi:ATP-dependent Clp protease adaptor protein ClpS
MIDDLAADLWPPRFWNAHAIPRFGYAEPSNDPLEGVSVLEDFISRVMLYNDNYHTFPEVIVQVRKAIGCSKDEGAAVAWQVHTRGKALVYEGEMMDCLKVSSVLEEIALHTQVTT